MSLRGGRAGAAMPRPASFWNLKPHRALTTSPAFSGLEFQHMSGLSPNEQNVFGSDAYYHPITGGIVEVCRGAASELDQGLAHPALRKHTDEKAGKAMRERVIAYHNTPPLKPVAKLQAEQKAELDMVMARQKSELDTLKADHKTALEAAQLAEKKAAEAKAKADAADPPSPSGSGVASKPVAAVVP